MKHPLHSLRLQLRCTQAALGLLVALLVTAATPGFRALLLDPANHPTTNVDLADAHWTGTLAAARLPAGALFNPAAPGALGATTPGTGKFTSLIAQTGVVPAFSGNTTFFDLVTMQSYLTVYNGIFTYGNLSVSGPASFDNGLVSTDGNGGLVCASLSCDNGAVSTDGSGDLTVGGSLALQGVLTTASGGTISTSPTAFANQLSPAPEGTIQPFTDSTTDTWGATITGGGSAHVLGYYDGTRWTVLAR